QRGGAGGAGVGHVVGGDAGLADLLLQLLGDAAHAHEVAGCQHTHFLHRHAAVGEGGQRRLSGKVDGVLVRVLAELGHVDPEDPDVVAHVLSPQFSMGSNPKPIASVPSSSVPTT